MTSESTISDADAASLSVLPDGPAGATPGGWSDWVGVVASVGCAIHCAAMPFVIAYLPALGLSFLADEAFHKWMALACFVIALMAFIPGLRTHRRPAPVLVASVGLAMISVAAFGFAGECCPSCAAATPAASADPVSVNPVAASPVAAGPVAANPVSADPAVSQGLATPEGAAVCTDAGCPHCANEGPSSSEDASGIASAVLAASPLGSWAERVAPWLTPLGGIVLVSAHLLNRRYGCLCGCCGSESLEGANG